MNNIPSQRRTANRHPEIKAKLRAIFAVTAMRDRTGTIVLCRPREVELAAYHPQAGRPGWQANNGKICFETENDADRAADGIAAIPGADRVVSYRCPRGGHFHHVSARRRSDSAWAVVTRIALAARRARGDQ
jgi:hypothetical protein